MSTSKEVFAARKAGRLDEAYLMALELMSAEVVDEWDKKAFAWCLVDLVKRESKSSDPQNLDHYQQQLISLNIGSDDEILYKQVQYISKLSTPAGKLQAQAKDYSKQGRHYDAVEVYKKIFSTAVDDQQLHISFGWEIYRLIKQLLEQDKSKNVFTVKKYLSDYLKLNVEKPSLLHTCILQIARNLAKDGELKLVPFLRIWGLENFQDEDYQTSVGKDGKQYPSFVESILQMASKEAVHSNNKILVEVMLPHITKAVDLFSDNIWFKYYLAKALLILDKALEAKEFSIKVCKAKQGDSWAWGLVGDVFEGSGDDITLACYCKALLCKNEESHKVGLRIKLIKLLVRNKHFSNAKYEIQQVLSLSDKYALKLKEFTHQDWYQTSDTEKSNLSFYLENAPKAENILFENLKWIKANLGEKFTIPDKNKSKYKIYFKTQTECIEVTVPERMVKIKNGKSGLPIKIKGEWDDQKNYKTYVVEDRGTGEMWDAFDDNVGIIDSINNDKKLFHYIVKKNIDGVIPFTSLPGPIHEGDAILLKLASYTSKAGKRFRVLDVAKTDKEADSSILKKFDCDEVRINGNIGFTETDIFIPPNIVSKYQLVEGSTISGLAVLNYNNKRKEWGWKVLKIFV